MCKVRQNTEVALKVHIHWGVISHEATWRLTNLHAAPLAAHDRWLTGAPKTGGPIECLTGGDKRQKRLADLCIRAKYIFPKYNISGPKISTGPRATDFVLLLKDSDHLVITHNYKC